MHHAFFCDYWFLFLVSVLSSIHGRVSRLICTMLLVGTGLLWQEAVFAKQPEQTPSPKKTSIVKAKKTAPSVGMFASDFCADFKRKMPHFDRHICEDAQLIDSGARSVEKRPILYRDIFSPQLEGEVNKTILGAKNLYEQSHRELGRWLGIKVKPEQSKTKKKVAFGAEQKEPVRVLVIGCTHGDELTSVALPLQWVQYAKSHQTGMHWRFIPSLNPDGLFAKKSTRTNANGVDLNRNFNTPNWLAETKDYWERRTGRDPRRYPGKSPLSEPESQYLEQQIESFKPRLIVSVHAPYGVLDYDGPTKPPNKIGSLYLKQVGIYPGSLGNYAGVQKKIPVVTLELKHALELPEPIEMHNMWHDLLVWMHKKGMR